MTDEPDQTISDLRTEVMLLTLALELRQHLHASTTTALVEARQRGDDYKTLALALVDEITRMQLPWHHGDFDFNEVAVLEVDPDPTAFRRALLDIWSKPAPPVPDELGTASSGSITAYDGTFLRRTGDFALSTPLPLTRWRRAVRAVRAFAEQMCDGLVDIVLLRPLRATEERS